MTDREKAQQPEDIARLFVERANAGDVEGLVALYEPDAVVGFPPGETTVGHDALREVYKQMLQHITHFEPESPLKVLRFGDLALTSTKPRDDAGARAQVARRQPDGSWLRILDRPDFSA